jgi:murein DD-endopeptidase MepM/ murein hydrolase activator NlpD
LIASVCFLAIAPSAHAETYQGWVRRYERQIRQQEKQLKVLLQNLSEKERDAHRWEQKAEVAKAEWSQASAAMEHARRMVASCHERLAKAHARAEAAQGNAVEETLKGESADSQMAVLVRQNYVEEQAPHWLADPADDARSRGFVIENLSALSQSAHGQAFAARQEEMAWREEENRWQNDEQKRSTELAQLRDQQQTTWLRWQTALRREQLLMEERNQLEQSEQALRVMLQELKDHRDQALALQRGTSYTPQALNALKGTLPWPVVGRVTQNFGRQYSKDLQQLLVSNGIKIEAAPGRTVRAVEAGKVLFANPFREYGLLVIVQHKNGLTSVYGGLGQASVQEGQRLAALDPVGTLGESGSFYFEMRQNEEPINPLVLLENQHSDVSLRRKFQ